MGSRGHEPQSQAPEIRTCRMPSVQAAQAQWMLSGAQENALWRFAAVLTPGAIKCAAKGWTEPPQIRACTHRMRRGQVRCSPRSGPGAVGLRCPLTATRAACEVACRRCGHRRTSIITPPVYISAGLMEYRRLALA